MNGKLCSVVAAVLCASPLAPAQERTPAAEMSLDPAAIAVLPVEVLSTNPTYPQLAEAVYEELLDGLGKIDGIHVIDPTSVEAYAASALEPEDIARQLGAATVLQSSVAAGPRGFTVRYACIDVQAGKHRFSGSMWSSDNARSARCSTTLPGFAVLERVIAWS